MITFHYYFNKAERLISPKSLSKGLNGRYQHYMLNLWDDPYDSKKKSPFLNSSAFYAKPIGDSAG